MSWRVSISKEKIMAVLITTAAFLPPLKDGVVGSTAESRNPNGMNIAIFAIISCPRSVSPAIHFL